MKLFFEARYLSHLKALASSSFATRRREKGVCNAYPNKLKLNSLNFLKRNILSVLKTALPLSATLRPRYARPQNATIGAILPTAPFSKNVPSSSFATRRIEKGVCNARLKDVNLLITTLLIFIATFTQAQNVKVTATVEDTIYLIGQHIPLSINLERTNDIEVQWPFLVDSLGGFEIIKSSKIDTTEASGKSIENQQLIITKFDTGYYVVPPIEFEYKENRRTQTVETEPFIIRMNTMEVDTTAAIMPIKNVIKMPLTFKEKLQRALLIAGIALLVLGIPLLLYFYFKRRNKEEYIPPPLPPYELAMKHLNELQAKKLWQEGNVKQYYIELTDILRAYIGRRFEINALEMTTDEIAPLIKKKKEVTKGLFRNSVDLLTIADYVKFAKARPSTKYHAESFDQVKQFVRATKPVEEVIENSTS